MWTTLMLTALASSVLTWGLAYLCWRFWIGPRMQVELQAQQAELERRVKQGVLSAGEEVLPAFRRSVADGFRDALTGLDPGALADDAARTVGDAADAVADRLQALLGLKPRD